MPTKKQGVGDSPKNPMGSIVFHNKLLELGEINTGVDIQQAVYELIDWKVPNLFNNKSSNVIPSTSPIVDFLLCAATNCFGSR